MPSNPKQSFSHIRHPCIIFDIGSKAIRALIGPRKIPFGHWQQRHFVNRSAITNLASAVQDATLPLDSPALKKIISFLKENLTPNIPTYAFATAAFRWLDNKKQVIAHIKRQTGIIIKVISAQEEAYCALLGICETHHMRRKGPPIPAGDHLLLIDQGGGSAEVSYIMPSNPNHYELFSFDDLGALALRKRIFHYDAQNTPIDAWNNTQSVDTQFSAMCSHIETSLQSWKGYPNLTPNRLHVYALGSATSSLFSQKSFTLHNKSVSLTELQQAVACAQQRLESYNMSMGRLYVDITAYPQSAEHKNRELLQLCGLPVYISILQKFSCNSLRLCGYGLRYGLYIAINKYNMTF